jgi:hypothetical protein
MRNVAPSHALVRRSRQLLQLAFLVVAMGTFLAVVGLSLFILPLAPKANQSYNTLSGIVFFFGIVIGLVGLAMGIRAITWRTDNDLALATGKFLEQHLDDRYTFIRNISKMALGYIDAVLVGPQGILTFRLLSEEGTFFNEKSQWLKQDKKGEWVPLRFNPTRQVVDDIQHLREHLAKQKLDIPVYGVIVFINDDTKVRLSAEKPTVPSTQLPWLMDKLRDNYLAKERIDQSTVTAVVKVLYGD